MKKIKNKAIGRFSFLFILIALAFFLTAGTIFYWEAWLYLATFVIQMIIILRFLLKNDPELLKRRMEPKETQSEQKLIVKLSSVMILSIFIIPGFDRRFEWSAINPIMVIIADLIFLVGYQFFFRVLRENSYASRTVKVEKDSQKVISTGPYAFVRHPMYLAIIIMYGSTPVALGSYFALIPFIIILILMPFRVKGEERLLVKELKGYKEYMEKTKYRIFPRIW
ncbi:MAG: methyltransferase family protein [Promethearchaeota archaeon]